MSSVSEERMATLQQTIGYGVIGKAFILILVPMFIPALLMNVLYFNFRMDPTQVLMVTVMVGCMGAMLSYSYHHKVADELHGKEMLILTFREGRGSVWPAFALIEHKHPITTPITRKLVEEIGFEEAGKLKKIQKELEKKETNNPGTPDPRLVPYEYIFKDFPPFERLILLQPCREGELLEFTPQTVVYKGLFVTASASPVDMTKVRELIIEDERIPIAIPMGCDYFTEHVQAYSKAFSISKDEIDTVVGDYDGFRCIELKQQLVTKDSELSSALKSLKDFDRAVDERATAKFKAYMKTRKHARTMPGVLTLKKTWLFFGLLVALAVVLFLVVRGV